MKDITPKAHLAPVIASSGCLGHIRFTARGYRAFDANDRLLGTFIDAASAAAAILTAENLEGQPSDNQ